MYSSHLLHSNDEIYFNCNSYRIRIHSRSQAHHTNSNRMGKCHYNTHNLLKLTFRTTRSCCLYLRIVFSTMSALCEMCVCGHCMYCNDTSQYDLNWCSRVRHILMISVSVGLYIELYASLLVLICCDYYYLFYDCICKYKKSDANSYNF